MLSGDDNSDSGNTFPLAHTRMSANAVSEPPTHHTLSNVAPRKRSRQESGCDLDSGLGDSEGGGGSGSGSSESGETGNGRQAGSQKRARSEGHGDPEVSRDSISWHRNAEPRGTSNQMHAPLAVSSAPTRLSSGSTTMSRYLNTTEALRESPSAESFIPLPPNSSTSVVHREVQNYGDSHSVSHTVEDDIARSMAFDEQMEVLRRSPISIPSSPIPAEPIHLAEPPVDAHAELEPDPSTSSEDTLSESVGELEVSAPEPRVRDEVNRPSSSGRLHALADTASMHSRLLHATTRRMTPTLPPILPPFLGQSASAASDDTSPSMPPSRLRILRRHEQSHVQPRSAARSSPSALDLGSGRDQPVMGSRGGLRGANEVSRPAAGGIAQPSSISTTVPPSPQGDARQGSAYLAPVRSHHTRARDDPIYDIHTYLDFSELLGDHPSPESIRDEDVLPLGFRSPAARRLRRELDTFRTHDSEERPPFELHISPSQGRTNHDHGVLDITANDRLDGPRRETASAPAHHRDGAGASPWRRNNRLPGSGSFWNGIFDETDSERDGSPRPTSSLFEENRRHTSDSERDAPFGHPRSSYDMFRSDFRRRSFAWDPQRRTLGQSESDHSPHTPSSSSSSVSSYGQNTSRSLLDPTLSFGSGSLAAHSHSLLSSTSTQEREQASRTSLRSRARLSPWFGGRRMELEVSPLDTRSERLHGESLAALSSFLSSMESTRSEDHSSPPGSSPHHTDSLRTTQAETARLMSAHLPPMDREQAPRPSLSSTYDLDRPTAARLPSQWENSPTSNMPDLHPGRSTRRRFSPGPLTRHPTGLSGPHDSDRPLSSLDLDDQPSPVSARFRIRRLVAQALDFPSRGPDLPADSMEDIIPESNARESDPTSSLLERTSPPPFAPGRQAYPRIEPPPRPIEPRLSWDVGPCPLVHVPPRRLRSPTLPLMPPMMRQDHDSPDAVHSTSTPLVRPQRPHVSYRSIFDRPVTAGQSEQPLAQRRFTPSVDGDEGLTSATTNSFLLDSRPDQEPSNQPSNRPLSYPTRHGIGTPHVETFNELVRRRAARAEAQARANRPPPSPETVFRPSYRLPRPSFLHHDEDTGRRDRMSRLERRNNAAFSGRTSTAPGSSIMEDSRRERLVRQHTAAMLLERSISSRYAYGDRPFNRHELERYCNNFMPSDPFDLPLSSAREERNDGAGSSVRTRMLERSRQAISPTSMDTFGADNAEQGGVARERQELHDAIGRRARDELSARRSLSNTDRARHMTSRDPMSIETTRNLQRRLRESEAEVGRALRALDQWGELEGSGDRHSDPTQSRMHRFGETLRRRRVTPAFNFFDTSMDQDSVPGSGSSNSARPGRRSPSPTTAAARLQARQARFARAQGRFREVGADMFGEPRSRSAYSSRLDMLGGFASRYITRNLGDYMRDEDFDASYENLVRLAASVGDAKPRGTPAHLLAAMPTGFYKDFATPGCDNRCPICLDDYKDLDPVLRISDCDHWFHKECLEQWLSGENSCPICRRRIRGRTQKQPSDDVPGPSGTRRDDGTDDDAPGGGMGGSGRVRSPELTLEELSSYAAGW